MEHNNTPIEQWIEETSNKETKILRAAYITGVQSVLRYLGLDMPDPKKWVEEYKTMESLHKSSSHLIRQLQSENNQYKKAIAEQAIDYQKAIDKLDAEIERLKELG
jgi:hypothetical protein